MTRSALQSLPGANVGLVRKYMDKKGQKRIVGVPDKLRQSQMLVCNLECVRVCNDVDVLASIFSCLGLALFLDSLY